MADDTDWESQKRIVRAGLIRFADEGYVHWTRENFQKLFHPYTLEDPRVMDLLRHWDASGAIQMAVDPRYVSVLDATRLDA
jgi:preprotein translocase subunit Sec61beta